MIIDLFAVKSAILKGGQTLAKHAGYCHMSPSNFKACDILQWFCRFYLPPEQIFLKVRQIIVYVFLGSINNHLLAFVSLNHPATSRDSTQVRCCICVSKLADSQMLS